MLIHKSYVSLFQQNSKKMASKVNKGEWFHKTKYQKRQVDFYKFFVVKKGLTIEQLIECCNTYISDIQYKDFNSKCKSLFDPFFGDFGKLCNIAQNKTGISFSKRPDRYDYTDIDNAYSLGDF